MSGEPIDRRFLVAMVACCIVPMTGIILLTGVVGWTMGTSAAVLIGVMAGAACVAVMVQRHRTGDH